MLLPGKTPQASFRLDPETVELLDALARKWGLTRTAVIKLSVRRAAEAEGVRPQVAPAPSEPQSGD
jgi:predicted transcriptional regulator